MSPGILAYTQTLQLRLWSFVRVPLLYRVKPSVVELSEERAVISVPLIRRNRNHLDSMYFGVLACGADIAGGLLAAKAIRDSGEVFSLVFRDFKADFLRRPESDTHFVCNEGGRISELLEKALASGEREEMTAHIEAYCPDSENSDPVARFKLTLCLKKRTTGKNPQGLGGLIQKCFPSFAG